MCVIRERGPCRSTPGAAGGPWSRQLTSGLTNFLLGWGRGLRPPTGPKLSYKGFVRPYTEGPSRRRRRGVWVACRLCVVEERWSGGGVWTTGLGLPKGRKEDLLVDESSPVPPGRDRSVEGERNPPLGPSSHPRSSSPPTPLAPQESCPQSERGVNTPTLPPRSVSGVHSTRCGCSHRGGARCGPTRSVVSVVPRRAGGRNGVYGTSLPWPPSLTGDSEPTHPRSMGHLRLTGGVASN